VKLSDLKIGKKYKIINIKDNKAFKYKFIDLGIKKDTEIEIENISILKANIKLRIRNYTVVMRDYEVATLEMREL